MSDRPGQQFLHKLGLQHGDGLRRDRPRPSYHPALAFLHTVLLR